MAFMSLPAASFCAVSSLVPQAATSTAIALAALNRSVFLISSSTFSLVPTRSVAAEGQGRKVQDETTCPYRRLQLRCEKHHHATRFRGQADVAAAIGRHVLPFP